MRIKAPIIILTSFMILVSIGSSFAQSIATKLQVQAVDPTQDPTYQAPFSPAAIIQGMIAGNIPKMKEFVKNNNAAIQIIQSFGKNVDSQQKWLNYFEAEILKVEKTFETDWAGAQTIMMTIIQSIDNQDLTKVMTADMVARDTTGTLAAVILSNIKFMEDSIPMMQIGGFKTDMMTNYVAEMKKVGEDAEKRKSHIQAKSETTEKFEEIKKEEEPKKSEEVKEKESRSEEKTESAEKTKVFESKQAVRLEKASQNFESNEKISEKNIQKLEQKIEKVQEKIEAVFNDLSKSQQKKIEKALKQFEKLSQKSNATEKSLSKILKKIEKYLK